MKPNPFDAVYKGILDRFEGVKSRLDREYSGTRPFNSREIPAIDQIFTYDSLTTEQKKALYEKYGGMAFLKYRAEMENLKRKRVTHGGKI